MDRSEIVCDDFDAMEIILRILHHYPVNRPSVESIAIVSIHARNYGCSRIVRPWILDWLGFNCQRMLLPSELGLSLLATLAIGAKAQYDATAMQIFQGLPASTVKKWASHPTLKQLPSPLISRQHSSHVPPIRHH
jgi:hypothetical protein